jgi:hypothetical protein
LGVFRVLASANSRVEAAHGHHYGRSEEKVAMQSPYGDDRSFFNQVPMAFAIVSFPKYWLSCNEPSRVNLYHEAWALMPR